MGFFTLPRIQPFAANDGFTWWESPNELEHRSSFGVPCSAFDIHFIL
jgi:hypothetical protein